MAVQGKIYHALPSPRLQGTLSAIEEATSSDPELAEQFAAIKLNCLCQAGETDEAREARQQVAGASTTTRRWPSTTPSST